MDAHEDRVRWQAKTAKPIGRDHADGGEIVFSGDLAGQVLAHDAESGKLLGRTAPARR